MENGVALVTGAGSGVGRATAHALLEKGWNVVLAGRRPDALQETIDTAPEGSDRATAVPTDVADPDAVRTLFGVIEDTFGRLDLLFNNAGVSTPARLEDVTDEQWLNAVATNLNGAFYCAREAFRVMKDQDPRGGRIINNGSVSAHAPRPNSAPYTATKHAITGLTKSTALDGREYDIACGQIDIGNAMTPMASPMAHGVPQADGSTAVEPLIDVRHVAEAVAHMASLPLDANILFMTVMATKMPFVGRG